MPRLVCEQVSLAAGRVLERERVAVGQVVAVHDAPVLRAVAGIGDRVRVLRLCEPPAQDAAMLAVDEARAQDHHAHVVGGEIQRDLLVRGAPLNDLDRGERRPLVRGAAVAVAVHPGAARVQHAAHATVERGRAQRLERGVIHVGGAVLAVERGVHGGVAVLEHAQPVVIAGEVTEDGHHPDRVERLGVLAAARQAEHPIPLAREACGDRAADVAGGSGDEDALVHGPAPWSPRPPAPDVIGCTQDPRRCS